jgi:hypothetical protein
MRAATWSESELQKAWVGKNLNEECRDRAETELNAEKVGVMRRAESKCDRLA